jgi:hypothetical protein
MKISEAACFNAEFPETYTWGQVDNLTAANVGGMIAEHIKHEARKPLEQRHAISGLRRALVLLAEYAEA